MDVLIDDLKVYLNFVLNRFAPFSSLTPRQSVFDQVNTSGPAPGAYDALTEPFARGDKAPVFGRSKVNRFNAKWVDTPGPGSYILPSSLRLKASGGGSTMKPGVKSGAHEHPLTQQPVPAPVEQSMIVNSSSNQITDIAEQTIRVIERTETYENAPIESVSLSLNGPEARRLLKEASTSHKSRREKSSKIIWKRKHVPPSIPVGHSAFGYQETPEGELLPRKPPKRREATEPAYLTSFAEQAKHRDCGYKFSKSEGRIIYKVIEGPGPNVYNPLKTPQGTKSGAIMALAPCKRLTDEIVNDAVKKSVPGPGAYQVETTLQLIKKGGIRFAGEESRYDE